MTRAEQAAAVLSAVLANPVNAVLLAGLSEDVLPDWILTAGCICQSVWNAQTNRDPLYGIHDYDVFYFDGTDLSYEAEDRAVRAALKAVGPIDDVDIQIRNQARVHFWYEAHFGTSYPVLRSARDGIDQFLTRSMAVGVRRTRTGATEIYAPDGLDDVLTMTIRPHVVVGRRALYEAKAESWLQRWPELTILPWPAD